MDWLLARGLRSSLVFQRRCRLMGLTYAEKQRKGQQEVARVLAQIVDPGRRAVAEDYIRDRRGRGDKAESKPWSTQVRDATAIEYLCRYMDHHCPPGMSFAELTPDEMRGWLDWMVRPKDPQNPGASGARTRQRLSIATRAGCWTMLQGFLKWTQGPAQWKKGRAARHRMPPHPGVDFDVHAEYTLTTDNELRAEDMLRPSEIASMYAQARGREKWAVACLGETGFRNNEVCKLNDKSYVQHRVLRHVGTGVLVPSGKLTLPPDEHYKTESTQRTIGIVNSVPALMNVMNEHPFAAYFQRSDLRVPILTSERPSTLLVVLRKAEEEQRALHEGRIPSNPITQTDLEHVRITEDGLRDIVARVARRAGIRKRDGVRVTPRLFRHSVFTLLVATGKLNDHQIKKRAGWAPTSQMIDRYAHINGHELNDAAVFRAMGYEAEASPERDPWRVLVPTTCPHCGSPRGADAYCAECFEPLRASGEVRSLVAQEHDRHG